MSVLCLSMYIANLLEMHLSASEQKSCENGSAHEAPPTSTLIKDMLAVIVFEKSQQQRKFYLKYRAGREAVLI